MKKFDFNIKLKIFLVVFLIIVLVLIGLIIKSMMNEDISIKKYKNDYISFEYSSNFNVSEIDESTVLETNDKNTSITIKKIESSATDEDKMAETIAYQVVSTDKYIEIYKNAEDDKYYYLFENYEKSKQIEVVELFKNNYVYLAIMQANSNEFDLYQQSFNIVLDSLKM